MSTPCSPDLCSSLPMSIEHQILLFHFLLIRVNTKSNRAGEDAIPADSSDLHCSLVTQFIADCLNDFVYQKEKFCLQIPEHIGDVLVHELNPLCLNDSLRSDQNSREQSLRCQQTILINSIKSSFSRSVRSWR
jgi:hypothetical protein